MNKLFSKSSSVLMLSTILSFSLTSTALHAGKRGASTIKTPVFQQRLIIEFEEASNQAKSHSKAQAASMAEFANKMTSQLGKQVSHMRSMALKNRQVFTVAMSSKTDDIEPMLNRLKALPNVKNVQVDALMRRQFTPNDSRFNEQWHYFETTGGMNATQAWDTHNGNGVVVAVLDTGYTSHTDLNDNQLTGAGYDFLSDASMARDGDGRDGDARDEGDYSGWFECGIWPMNSSWHGTHVSGTIAAETNNGQGVAGVAYGAKILPVRVLGKCGGYLSDITDAIIWASGGSVPGVPVNQYPAQVINMSLGGSGACDSTYQAAIDTARANGATVVVAAGNSNADVSGFRPASCQGVIAVAANDRQGNRASYSNYGATVDVTAPGGETNTTSNGVLSTLNSGARTAGAESYAFYQGTSMASPHVAGVAALLYQANPAITPDQVEAALKATARPMPGTCSGGCGAGIIDARAAIDYVTGN